MTERAGISKLASQIAAIRQAMDILSGKAAKPSERERSYIVGQLGEALMSFQAIQRHEPAIRETIRLEIERARACTQTN